MDVADKGAAAAATGAETADLDAASAAADKVRQKSLMVAAT